MTDIIPTAAEAKDLADDCCEALAGLLLRPTTTARRPFTERILAEMQKALNNKSWHEAVGWGPGGKTGISVEIRADNVAEVTLELKP